ncbi:tRNA pseudouridine(55) synthase TruB [Permianibacter aggregans]|uniref:tRNA pseudouridine synthase B n=1 Tax=Permianibacter aggregans TaxID=1510150 RepID=A0A4R6US71_9GAMM|nr:tRNA pseudouridine(55) synthase TruB [Permianibacter aggregans]QGX39354.1 tRNA pseudouridine(55) synthase TruB [Permianibacter aggregans]TDQ49912.1 tRNA pseudouridine synthase B [Permianibacter aggregans]
MQVKIPRRPISGVLLLDKITGVSSNSALQRVKRLYQAEKAGHTGSLDPLASGLLPICLGEATKFSQYLLDADKVYEVTAKFGVRTDTFDAEGKVLAEQPAIADETKLRAVVQSFLGEQQQLPPMYSALKKDGKPLYELARQGIEIERETRTITIFSLDIVNIEWPQVAFRVHCSKGTYIRTLIDDMGLAFGCGAYVTVLRRTAAGHFSSEQMLTSDAIDALKNEQGLDAIDQLLLPIESLIPQFPIVTLKAPMAHFLMNGQAVYLSSVKTEGLHALFREDGTFLGVGEADGVGNIQPKRLVRLAD